MSNKKLNLCTTDRACLNWISIDPDGNIYPCEYLRSSMPYGNIKNINFNELQNNINYKNFKKTFLNKNDKCKSCDFFDLCGNGCPVTRIKNNKIKYDGVYVYCESKQNLFKMIKNILNK